jgi:hypothetical protein
MLFIEEVDALTTTNKLCTGFINLSMLILQNLFPLIGGLNCSTLGQHINFPKATGEKWMQIVHDGYDHWVLVAMGFFEPDVVLVYDSLAGPKWSSQHIIGCMTSLLRTPEKEMKYKVKACQRQGNGYDCGVFAIAFATSLAYGEDPSKLSYDTKQLRNHLRACMESNRLTPFPSTKCAGNRSRRETMATEDVHCSCRRSEYMVGSDKMVECDVCKEWYHKSCVPNYPRSVKKIWKCQQCKSKV